MKILTSSLLVTIAIFLHFCELNAIDLVRRQSSRGVDDPTKIITYKNNSFAVWESSDGTFVYKVHLQPKDYIADEPLCILPRNVGIEYVDEQGVQFVLIKTLRGQFLAALAGKISSELPGRPTEVINYEGHKLGLWKRRGVAYEVRLLPKNFVPFTSFFQSESLQTHCIHKDGIWMLVHAISSKIVGVELSHDPTLG